MIVLILILLGLCWGSFVNALVWRLHKQAGKGSTRQYSIVHGTSMCPHCKHRLHAKDLIPVLSWVVLHGRCRYCHKQISWQYPAVELTTAGLFLLSYLVWPYSLSGLFVGAFVMWLVATVILMALLVYDLRWLLLPNRLVYPLTLLAASFVAFQAVALQNWTVLLHALLGAIVLSGLFWSLFQISQGRWIGGGDVKIAVGLGLLAGSAQQSLLLLFIASLLGTLYGLPILIRKRPSHKVPFGPFLITATVIVVLWGQAAADWYLRTAGL